METRNIGSIQRDNYQSGTHPSSISSDDLPINITDSFHPRGVEPAVDIRKAAQAILKGSALEKVEVAWKFETGDVIITPPAINSAGTVFIGNCTGKVFAINGKTGEKLWELKAAKELKPSPPVIGSDGSVYVLSNDNRIIALDEKTGQKKWNKKFEMKQYGELSSCTVSPGGELYLIASRMVIAFDEKTKKEMWKKEVSTISGLPSFGCGPEGNLIIGGGSSRLVSLERETGKELWNYGTKGLITDPPVVAPDGTVYLGDMSGKVAAINGKTGKELWKFETKNQGPMSPLLGPGDTLYCMSNFRNIYVFDRHKGAKKWDKTIGEALSNTPIVDRNGTAYYIGKDRKLTALEGDSGKIIGENKLEFNPSSDPAFFSGMFYQGDDEGILFALREKPLNEVIENASAAEGDKEKDAVRDTGDGYVVIAGIKLPVKDSLQE